MTTQELIEAAQQKKDWTIGDAVSLYMTDRWGAGYFHVAENGDMTVAPLQQKGAAVPIIDVVREAQTMNLSAAPDPLSGPAEASRGDAQPRVQRRHPRAQLPQRARPSTRR